jgi:hypothetical protein
MLPTDASLSGRDTACTCLIGSYNSTDSGHPVQREWHLDHIGRLDHIGHLDHIDPDCNDRPGDLPDSHRPCDLLDIPSPDFRLENRDLSGPLDSGFLLGKACIRRLGSCNWTGTGLPARWGMSRVPGRRSHDSRAPSPATRQSQSLNAWEVLHVATRDRTISGRLSSVTNDFERTALGARRSSRSVSSSTFL